MRQPCFVTDTLDKATHSGLEHTITTDKIRELDRNVQVGFWLIDANISIQQAQHCLSIIRQQLIPNVYLRPIVFLSLNHNADDEIKLSGCDAVLYQSEEIEAQITKITAVLGFIILLSSCQSSSSGCYDFGEVNQGETATSYILEQMLKVQSTHSEKLSPYAPLIMTIKVPESKIREIIGK